MLRTGDMLPWGFGAFSIFAVLAGLTLLVGADYASPGCTGPEVQRCDYVASAQDAVARSEHHPFKPTSALKSSIKGLQFWFSNSLHQANQASITDRRSW